MIYIRTKGVHEDKSALFYIIISNEDANKLDNILMALILEGADDLEVMDNNGVYYKPVLAGTKLVKELKLDLFDFVKEFSDENGERILVINELSNEEKEKMC